MPGLNLHIFTRFVIAVLLAAGLTGCMQSAHGIDSISLQRTRCFGVCPVYTVTVHADGQVEFSGVQFVESVGQFRGRIERGQFDRLAEYALSIDFFGLEDEYRYGTAPDGSRVAVSDLPSRVTTVIRGGQKKTVLNYYDGPAGLEAFEQLIDEVTGSSQWIGQPPF